MDNKSKPKSNKINKQIDLNNKTSCEIVKPNKFTDK